MQALIEFLLECFLLGRSSKAERRNAYGCIFAILGAFAVFVFALVAAAWPFLRP